MSTYVLPEWVLWIQAIGIPACGIVVAFASVFIAWHQKRLADLKLQSDLYDRRLKIFEAAKALLVAVQDNGTLSVDEYFAFIKDTANAVFLLKPNVADYLKTLGSRAVRLRLIQNQLKSDQIDQPTRAQLADKAAEMELWFNEQFNVLIEEFKPSLRLDLHSMGD
jgi:hypothetical protein